MKLLDPFSGYKLLIGHPLFHLALFTASWMLVLSEKDIKNESELQDPLMYEDLRLSYEIMKWSHLIVVLMLSPSLCATKKDIKKIDELGEDEDKVEEIGPKNKIHMCARLTETLGIFVYTGAVFYS
jgi:hypothetical protein